MRVANFETMPVVSKLARSPSSPSQRGTGINGQYVYWIVMVQPTPEVLQAHGLKKPEKFSRTEFGKFMVQAYWRCGITLVEIACFMEPHVSGLMHHNCLVQATQQCRWKDVAETLFKKQLRAADAFEQIKHDNFWHV